MLVPEGALPLDWRDRMSRVLTRRFIKDKDNLCSACGEPVWPAEDDETLRDISASRPVLIKWTDDEAWSPYAIDGLHAYQFCGQCRSD